eukprot:g6902.t1
MERPSNSKFDAPRSGKDEVFGFVLKRVPESLLTPIELKSRQKQTQFPTIADRSYSLSEFLHTNKGDLKTEISEKKQVQETNKSALSVREDNEAGETLKAFVKEKAPLVNLASPLEVMCENRESSLVTKEDSFQDRSLNVTERSLTPELLSTSGPTKHSPLSEESHTKDHYSEICDLESGSLPSSISDTVDIANEEQDIQVEDHMILNTSAYSEEKNTLSPFNNAQGELSVEVTTPENLNTTNYEDVDVETRQESVNKNLIVIQPKTEAAEPRVEQEGEDSTEMTTRQAPIGHSLNGTRILEDSIINTVASTEPIDNTQPIAAGMKNQSDVTKSKDDKQIELETAPSSDLASIKDIPDMNTASAGSVVSTDEQRKQSKERRKAQLHQSEQIKLYLSKSPSKQDAEELIHLANELKAHVEQVYDEPPSPEEVKEFAAYLGMDVKLDERWFFIAEWAMTAPLPIPWTVHLDSSGGEYFHNPETKASQYEHPMDAKYKELYFRLKENATNAI